MRQMARYIIDNDATIRDTAKYFGWSKSTVAKHCTKSLKEVDYYLYLDVSKVMNEHKETRGSKGGNALRNKHLSKFRQEVDIFLEKLNNGID